jgi:hypothetical protein
MVISDTDGLIEFTIIDEVSTGCLGVGVLIINNKQTAR